MAAVERIINGTATTVFYMTDKAYELAVATINEIGTRINDIRDSVKDEVGQAESAVLQLNVESKKIVKLYRELKALGVDVNNMEEEKQPIDYKARQQETVDARKEKMASRR